MGARARKYVLGVLACCAAAVAGCGGGSSGVAISGTSLPAGNVGAAYSASLLATGGTSPYTWTVTSGTPPPGLNFSGGGIGGIPTTAGKTTFSVMVTDSTTPTAETATTTVTILIGNMQITTTSLPAGVTNVKYSATLNLSGGTGPYAWSVISGALPAGLALGTGTASTNTISGTPTVGGVATFTIQVTDSESPAVTTSQKYTISLSPLALMNTSLPNGLQGTAYSLALGGTGGATPYAWSKVSGSFPGGLSLNTTSGVISGTPTGSGTSVFTIGLQDAEIPPETQSVTLSLTIEPAANACAGAPTGNEALLSGNYALLVQGFQGGGAGNAVAVAGSFAATGGQVTGGDIDVSNTTGATHYTVAPYSTGAPYSLYTVGLDPNGAGNLGCVMLTTSVGTTMTFRFSLGGVSGGVASKGKVIEFDDTSGAGTVASGVMALQDTSAFSASKLSAAYAFGLDGASPTGQPPVWQPLAEAGSFSASSSGGISSVFADVDTAGTNSSALSGGSGSITGISTDGRGTASFTEPTTPTTTFAWTVYIVNANEMYLVSTAFPAGGRALATTRAFNAGNYVFYSTGITSCGGSPCADVNLGLLNLTGGAVSGPLWDYNVSAAPSMGTITGTYTTAASSGRVTFANVGSNGLVAYLVSPVEDGVSAITVGTDAGAHFGFATLQAGTSVPSEKVFYGTLDPRSNALRTYIGTASIAGATVTATEDGSSQIGGLGSGLAVIRTVSLAGSGTGSVATPGGSNVAVTDGTRIFWFDYGGAPAVITVAEPQ